MKNILILICLLLFTSRLHSQEYPSYSITADVKLADTVSIKKLINDGRKITNAAPDSALSLLRLALSMSLKINHQRLQNRALQNIANAYNHMGRYEEAVNYYTRSLSTAENLPVMAATYTAISHVYYLWGNYKSAAAYCYKVVDAASTHPYWNLNPAGAYVNLSVIWWQLGDSLRSTSYLKAAQQAAIEEQNLTSLADVTNKLGNRFLHGPMPDSGYYYYTRALALARQVKDTSMEMVVMQNLGEYYRIKGNNAKAEEYIRRSMQLAQNPSVSPYFKLSTLRSAGETLFKMKMYDEAEACMLQSMAQLNKSNTKVYAARLYAALATIYTETGRYEKAVKMQELYIAVRDSLLSNDNVRAINALEIKYKTALKDAEIARKQLLLEKELARAKRKNIYIFVLFFCAVIIAAIGVQLYRINRVRRHLDDERALVMAHREQIQLLRATIRGEEKERTRIGRELHDGTGSMLSVIKMGLSVLGNRHTTLSGDDQFNRLLRMVDETTSDIRETAHNLMPDPLLKGGMDEALNIFCESVRKKYDTDLTLQYYGEMPRLDAAIERSLFRIIQELIQYRILKKATHIFLQINWQAEILSLILEDNGQPFNETTTAETEWTALSSRIRMMNAHIETAVDTQAGNITDIEFDLLYFNSVSSEYA